MLNCVANYPCFNLTVVIVTYIRQRVLKMLRVWDVSLLFVSRSYHWLLCDSQLLRVISSRGVECYTCIVHTCLVLSIAYCITSTLEGLMQIAMGRKSAILSRRMASPPTPSRQCLPCTDAIRTNNVENNVFEITRKNKKREKVKRSSVCTLCNTMYSQWYMYSLGSGPSQFMCAF